MKKFEVDHSSTTINLATQINTPSQFERDKM